MNTTRTSDQLVGHAQFGFSGVSLLHIINLETLR